MPKKLRRQVKSAPVQNTGDTPEDVNEVRILWETEPPPLHCNFAAVGFRPPGEFAVSLCALSAGPPRRTEKGLVVDARILSSVRMNAITLHALLVLMVDQFNKWASAQQGGEEYALRLEQGPSVPSSQSK